VGASRKRNIFDPRWPLTSRSPARSRRPGRAADLTALAASVPCELTGRHADADGQGRADAAPAGVRLTAPAGSTGASGPGTHPGTLADLVGLRPEGRDHGPDSEPGPDLLASAREFLALFHAEHPEAGSLSDRIEQVRGAIGTHGTYRHTAAELTFAGQVAWRNSARCIGRLYWRSLRVRDRRQVRTAADVAAESFEHLRTATNSGRIRPVITVFAPDAPGRPGPRILSPQLVSYAGYENADGTVTGDPAGVPATRLARQLGWRPGPDRGRFDVLPLLVAAAGERPAWYEVPPDAVLEVPLQHPDLDWFADLGLRWYAVPVISDMYLEAGGIRYPAAPFNGWYLGTEIGSRDLGDTGRYNQLPEIAARMGLSTASDRTLWRDRAVTELNVAVLHSFSASGVTITDHHTESVRFLKHLELEERQGRACPADWTWIVPPAASSTTPVFHRYYEDFDQSPRFARRPGGAGCPV